MICPKCGEQLPGSARACRRCGTIFEIIPKADTKPCPSCGEEMPSSALNCLCCGYAFEAAEQETRICPVCGEELPASEKVCWKCETVLGQEPQVNAIAAKQQPVFSFDNSVEEKQRLQTQEPVIEDKTVYAAERKPIDRTAYSFEEKTVSVPPVKKKSKALGAAAAVILLIVGIAIGAALFNNSVSTADKSDTKIQKNTTTAPEELAETVTTTTAATTTVAEEEGPDDFLSEEEQDLLYYMNLERSNASVGTLKINKGLSDLAETRCEELKQDFGFVRPNGEYAEVMIKRIMNDSDCYLAEMIVRDHWSAYDVMYEYDPDNVVYGWMHEDHDGSNKELVLSADYTEIGIAYVPDGGYWDVILYGP